MSRFATFLFILILIGAVAILGWRMGGAPWPPGIRTPEPGTPSPSGPALPAVEFPPLHGLSVNALPAELARLHAAVPSVTDRFRILSAAALGTPATTDDILGDGPGAVPDPDPRIDLARVNCVTLVEQCLAFSLPEAANDPVAALDRVRYRDGKVSFLARNHFFCIDWVEANADLIEDVTRAVGGERCRLLRRTIERAAFFRENEARGYDGPARDPRTLWILPKERLADVADAIDDGTILGLIGSRSDLFARHVGIAVRRDGHLLLRHASSESGRVEEVPLDDYVTARTWCIGFQLLAIRAD